MKDLKKIIKSLLLFSEPEEKEQFILKEKEDEMSKYRESFDDAQSGSDEEAIQIFEQARKKERNKRDRSRSVLKKPVELSEIMANRSGKGDEPDSGKDQGEKQTQEQTSGQSREEEHSKDKRQSKDKGQGDDQGQPADGDKDKAKGAEQDQKKQVITGDTDKKSTKSEEENEEKEDTEIVGDITANLRYMKKVYNVPVNSDIVIREFDINVKDKVIPAFLIFIDGMVNSKLIDDAILKPLMLLSNMDIKSDENGIEEYVESHILPHLQLKKSGRYSEVIGDINYGSCALFIDGMKIVFVADVKGWEHRGVDRPVSEMVIRGPQEGFTEQIRANTSLVRRMLKDENLIVENIQVGRRSKTPCAMLYIKDIANDSLVNEVRRRIKSIKTDYILDSGELEQMIEDSTFSTIPQIVSTERPDRICSMLAEGKVAVIVSGSPYVLAMPATLATLMQTPEDAYLRFPYSNLLRLLRVIAMLLSLLLPGIYVAITNFHQEMIPTDLLFAIAASRETVPFPSVLEILIMEIAFELIREAGLRIPGIIGTTIGIIGALILGQAAVAANIVSPILIIIVAVTGIGSFAVPNFSMAFSFRINRFIYIILGAMAGFLGVTVGLFIQGIMVAASKSFGVPFLTPFGPKTIRTFSDTITRGPIWKQEFRPDYLNAKEVRRQPHISREWTLKGKKGEKKDEE